MLRYWKYQNKPYTLFRFYAVNNEPNDITNTLNKFYENGNDEQLKYLKFLFSNFEVNNKNELYTKFILAFRTETQKYIRDIAEQVRIINEQIQNNNVYSTKTAQKRLSFK